MTTTPPYEFIGPYADCYRFQMTCADKRHVYTMHDVLRSWPFKCSLELGCYDGASSTAFIEAQRRDGFPCRAMFCDLNKSTSLASVLAYGQSADFVQGKSWDLLARLSPGDVDFVFVDAAHDLESVSKELEHLLRLQPLCVMAHDTNATRAGYPAAEGAQHLADTLRKHPAYRGKCIEDAVRRRGEETHRGLFFATTDQELYEKARDIFRSRCPVMEMQTA